MPLEAQNPKVSPFHFASSPLPFLLPPSLGSPLAGVGWGEEPPYRKRLFQEGSGGWVRVGWGKKRRGAEEGWCFKA